ncbi:MAG: ATP-binding protein [bacterium]
MNITHVESTSPLGPLPPVTWEPKSCSVIYDDNQTGKTTLIDILINTVFNEGIKLFEQRYDSYESCQVTVQGTDDEIIFGRDGTGRTLSGILGWDMPELHRFLCIRAGETQLMRPSSTADPEDIWKSLASVIGGVRQDQLESIADDVAREARLISPDSLRWSNRDSEDYSDYVLDELTSRIQRAEEAENQLKTLIEVRSKNRKVQSRRDELQDEKLVSLNQKVKQLETYIEKKRWLKAETLLEKVQTLQSEIQSTYGDRVQTEFDGDWFEALEQRQEIKETLTELRDLRDKTQRLRELNEKIEAGEKRVNEIESEFEQKVGKARTYRRDTLTPLVEEYNRVIGKQESFTFFKYLYGAGVAGGVIGASVLGWLFHPASLIGGVAISSGVFLSAVCGFLLYRGTKLSYRRREIRNKIEQSSKEWFEIDSEHEFGTVIDRKLDQPVEEWIKEDREKLEEKRDSVQSLKGEKKAVKSSVEGKVTSLEIDVSLEAIDQVEDHIEQKEQKLERVEQTLDDLRSKTGCPDYETFREKLEKRQEKEEQRRTARARLSGYLQFEEDQDVNEIQVMLDRKLASVEDVDPPDDSIEELESKMEDVREQKREVEQEIKDYDQRLDNLDEREERLKSSLIEDGIPFDRPQDLFEQQHEWNEELEDALLDRLGAAFAVQSVKRLQGGYRDEIKQLLDPSSNDRISISSLYRKVMGDDTSVEFQFDDMSFTVMDGEDSIPESQLSTGARTHLYLSCRLAVVEHLFPDDPGFIVLDDPFLPYFPSRKEKAVQMLEPMIEQGWQVLLFTVDPHSRDLFEEHLSASVQSITDLQHDGNGQPEEQ